MTPQQTEQLKVLEAMLFASADPLTPQAIHERLPSDADLNVLLTELRNMYSERGINLVETGGAWAFRTSTEVAGALTIEKDVERKLSRAALETMAVIAYHQPITRAEIENIRGVATHKGTLDALMEMGWVKPGKRREAPGRPLTWVTTPEFLDHFSLSALTDLPGLEDLKAPGLLDKRPAIETIPASGDLFEEDMPEKDEDEDDDDSDYDAEDDDAEFEEEAAA